MRVFAATLATETNVYSPLPTGIENFKLYGSYYPAGEHPDHMTHTAAPLWVARERAMDRKWDLFEGTVAVAMPAGLVTRDAYEALRDQILSDLEAVLPMDIVVLGLHGAMVADGYDDCEGDLIARIRDKVGRKAVIGATLDPHCHLTRLMRENADVLITYKEYPHTDLYERAIELLDICEAQAEGKIRPVFAIADTGMIVPVFTTSEPGLTIVKEMKELEQIPKVLSISLVQGFAWSDVPEMGSSFLVYTDNDPELAREIAMKLAKQHYDRRANFWQDQPNIDEALDQALRLAGPVVIADGADNAGGGAASDSTFFLARMLERKIGDAALGPLWDPVAVQLCIAAGKNARLQLRVGGKVGKDSGAPLDISCVVVGIFRDMKMKGLSDAPVDMGDCVLIDIDGIQVVLTTKRAQAINIDLFTQLGCDLQTRRIIVVKSSQHFYASFSRVAKHVIYASAQGTLNHNFKMLPYKRISLPRWPITNTGEQKLI